jgi:hypothetical protein
VNRMRNRLAVPAAALAAGISAELLGDRAFSRLVQRDVQGLLAHAWTGEARTVTEDMLAGLPAPVRRYLTWTGIVGKPLVHTVYLRQQGKIRPGNGQLWLPLDAQEYYAVQPPGFVWDARLHLGPLPVGRGRDRYANGRGSMLIKAASVVTVVDASGEAMDQGSMLRYLNEMMWFPTAFLGDNISFQAIDDNSARVTLTDHGRTATATMSFDPQGRLTEFVAKRYAMAAGSSQLATWSVPITEYGEFAGLRLPVRCKAVWKLADGDLDYIDVRITELQYTAEAGGAEPPAGGRRRSDAGG